MIKQLMRSVVMSVIFLVFLGLVYPLAETGVAQALFPQQANGSLTKYGSLEVGQQWGGARVFHGRLDPYNPRATGGSNLELTSQELVVKTRKAIAMWHRLGVNPTEELVTNSGSGVDPDISIQSAMVQIPMIAKARRISAATLKRLVESQVIHRQLGFLGENYLNVLQLNVALSKLR
ncbi:K+-transporting ATPase ATPase C chain [Ferrithrix thermotolerans DSM 19514]|uniref:Potassium-transporting ATPase KdpC subunit n=1 Tax=Ferrithrix thermotolerans DSM 19514 TaxID=1121881 RepID=A0A1M4WYA8_9ACTN|nr:potassium-transporting ATPase subunit C [Ferrithrix thermotolerans]SHE86180.1 K+-transporting ATPase ATPase C chain [Ferrithrix thermotolerans DSM 19514]